MARGYVMPDGSVLNYEQYMGHMFGEVAGGFMGVRAFGTGAKLPAWLQPVEKGIKAGKWINEKRGDVNWRIMKATRKSNFPKRDMTKKARVKQTAKDVARNAWTKKGKALIGTAIATALQTGSNNPEHRSTTGSGTSSMDDTFIFLKKKEKNRKWVTSL